MADEECAYFYRRAEQEIELACASVDERLVSFHYRLADLYLNKVYGIEVPGPGIEA